MGRGYAASWSLCYHDSMRLPDGSYAQSKLFGSGWMLALAALLFGCSPEKSEKSGEEDDDKSNQNDGAKDGAKDGSSEDEDSSESSETSSGEDNDSSEGDSGTDDSSEQEPVPKEYRGKENPFKSDDADAVKAGKALYVEHCQGCHAPDGKGELPGMPDLRTPKAAKWPDDRLLWKVSDGSGDAMPGSKGILSEEEIWQSITYVRTLSSQL